MPKLNKVRHSASACSLGDAVYVYGGTSKPGKEESTFVNSIEKLCNPAASDFDAIKPWVLIQLPKDVSFPMTRGIFMPVNSFEIAIIGRRWYAREDYLFSCTFDTSSCTFKSTPPEVKISPICEV